MVDNWWVTWRWPFLRRYRTMDAAYRKRHGWRILVGKRVVWSRLTLEPEPGDQQVDVGYRHRSAGVNNG